MSPHKENDLLYLLNILEYSGTFALCTQLNLTAPILQAYQQYSRFYILHIFPANRQKKQFR